MNHLILGAGNLGLDLRQCLRSQGEQAFLLSANCERADQRWNYDFDGIRKALDYCEELGLSRWNYVWCPIGSGSVEKAKKEFGSFLSLGPELAFRLSRHADVNTRLIFFSSNYVADEFWPNDPGSRTVVPRSLYAASKLFMEETLRLLGEERSRVIRVQNLYGNFRPCHSLAWKLNEAAKRSQGRLVVPDMEITPTPTWWLAETLVSNLDELFARSAPLVHHVAPEGAVTLAEFAQLAIPTAKVEVLGYDNERPPGSHLDCSLDIETPNWRALWRSPQNELARLLI